MQNDFSVKEKRKVFTVTEATLQIKKLLELSFTNIWIEGEISDLKRPGSGHAYFILKDNSSQIKAVMFRFNNQRLRFALENGIKIIAQGTISVYDKRGEYQIIIEAMEPTGLGALQLAFEQLKKKLFDEGLFNTERKRPIPIYPKKIGIVTSSTGAAIKDILNVINRRFCNVHIIINPVRVQGKEAPTEIANAIQELNKFEDIDVMIVGRGGGSLEDLWAFNEEVVARAIYESGIPVISAVGHEIDYTIADFVADLRAPTPSAAAELVVQNKTNIENIIKMNTERLESSIKNVLNIYKNKTTYLAQKKCFVKPQEIFQDKYQEVDYMIERIKELTSNFLAIKKEKINTIHNSILHLSPLAILSRGYSLALILPEKKLLTNSKDALPGQEIEIKLSHGEIICEVKKAII
ncbi:exodeoxyribonuclease VII large subunit [Candidatus Poribacteria bacterium]|nr:exodeoxyribonuclease VII large subunit [Candidatus Poribacteria bacterium]